MYMPRQSNEDHTHICYVVCVFSCQCSQLLRLGHGRLAKVISQYGKLPLQSAASGGSISTGKHCSEWSRNSASCCSCDRAFTSVTHVLRLLRVDDAQIGR